METIITIIITAIILLLILIGIGKLAKFTLQLIFKICYSIAMLALIIIVIYVVLSMFAQDPTASYMISDLYILI